MRFYKLTAQNFFLAVVLFFSLSGFADVSYQGRIIKPNGTPLTANLVTFSILIQNPNGTCTLYSENQSVNMQSGDGLFSLSIGSGTRTDAGSTPFSSIFSDSVTIAPNSTCLAGYTKSSSDVLSLRIAFNDGGSDGPQYLDPVAINSVPHAMEAAAVAGVASSSVLRVSGATAPPLTAANYTDLLALINGTSSKYAVTSSNGAVSIPVFSGNPTAPTTGQIWYDSVGNTVKYFDGTTSQTFGTAGAGLSSLNGLNSNTQSFAVGTGGTSPAWSSSVATHTLNIPMASTSSVTAGLLSYADWTTFNNKQSSGNYITALTGDVTATGPGSVGATIANNAVTTSKLFANPGISRLVITDSTTGGTLAPISCGLNQFLTWTVTGWTCTTPGSITAAGALTFAAGGTNENVTLTPSGTGYTILNGNVGIGTTSPTSKLHIINTHSVAMGTEEIDNYTQSTYAIADTGMKEALSARATATHTSGVIGSIVSVLGLSKATGVGGEVNNQIAFFARNDVSTGASVDSTFGVMVNDGTGTSGPTNQYGVYVKQLTNATNNFAVYTAGTTKSYFGGNVGIGTTTPRESLDVNGTVVGKAAVSNGTGTVNFSTGNTQYTTSDCGAFALHNMKDGGGYVFIVQGATSATCSFTAYSDAGTTALTVHMPPDHSASTVNKHTMYNFLVAGTHVYVAWTPGY